MKQRKILFLVNHEIVIYNFRKEIVERFLSEGYDVIISSPYGKKIDELISMGCQFVEVNMDRHGTNFISELKLIHYYSKLFDEVKPDIIFGFTIKPNIYGAIAAKKEHIPFVANITGLGTAVENPGILQKITIGLYKFAFTDIQTVFFQNKENRQFFIENNIAIGKHKLLPGSGVNLKQFSPLEYPSDDTIEFVFISRIMKEKGIEQYLEAAEYITNKYSNTKFHVCGFCEEEYEEILKKSEEKGILVYHGMVDNISSILKNIHCTIHPTFYPEGISNVLLESAATGRPVITTDRSGCKEVVDDGESGYIIKQKDSNDLIKKIECFLNISNEDRENMGMSGRKIVEEKFDRQIVVNEYMNQIE